MGPVDPFRLRPSRAPPTTRTETTGDSGLRVRVLPTSGRLPLRQGSCTSPTLGFRCRPPSLLGRMGPTHPLTSRSLAPSGFWRVTTRVPPTGSDRPDPSSPDQNCVHTGHDLRSGTALTGRGEVQRGQEPTTPRVGERTHRTTRDPGR